MLVLDWVALGFKLAYAKGQLAVCVTWISGTLTVEPDGVIAAVKGVDRF